MKVSCLNKISKVGTALFTSDYEVIGEDVSNADAILVRSAQMHEMELPKSVLAVARAGAGVNNIPLDKYANQGVVVFNTPGANANAVKELIIASLLLASRDIIGGNNWVKDNKDDEGILKSAEKAKAKYAGGEILGKTISVIGLGAIGILVSNACIDLGLNVVGYDPFLSINNALKLNPNVKFTASLEDAVSQADFITLHVPALDSTKNMVNTNLISKMKDGVKLLNFSRETLIVEADVNAALESGKIAKYVTDFATPASVKMPNTIVLPHLGASTEEAEDNCAMMAVNQIMNYIENGNIVNSVNYPNCDAGVCKSASRVVINHKNEADIISKITEVLANKNIKIANMVSKSKGDYAYMILDLEEKLADASDLESICGVIKVRIIK